MSTDYRALCAELTDFLAELPFGTCEELVVRARAALMADGPAVLEGREPASVVGEPSDEEIIQEAIKADLVYRIDGPHVFSGYVESHALNTYVLSLARAILARWGHQPAPPVAGEVAQVVAWLRAWALGTMEEGQPATSRSLTRAAELLEQRQPAPPAEGEVAELVAEIRHFLAGYRQIRGLDPEYVYSIHRGDAMEAHIRISRLARAADLLAQRYPEPVSVEERPWEREGWCDDQGRCWWTAGPDGRLPLSLWLVNDPAVCTSGVMLPAHAIPVPAGEVQ